MTLKEIAARAGVSISTVSRVLNQPDSSAAGKEVRERIWAIVRETGYQPNQSARLLRLGKAAAGQSRAIGCIFARSAEAQEDPFFSSIAQSLEQEAFRLGYILRYSFSAQNLSSPTLLQNIAAQNVDGVAVLGRFDKRLMRFLKEHYRNVVITGLNPVEADYDQVICNGHQAAETAVNYLASLGHHRIAYLGEIDNEARWRGFCAALEQNRLPLDRSLIIETPITAAGGYRGGLQLAAIADRASAVFCANDQTAIGAMKALHEKGIRIPQQLSVISIDDIEMAQYVSPMLTTIRIPVAEMGRQSARTLIERIEGSRKLNVKIEVPFSLTRRESCGRI
jgi:DNA-binding LacI/PurR family transcriptional regulator